MINKNGVESDQKSNPGLVYSKRNASLLHHSSIYQAQVSKDTYLKAVVRLDQSFLTATDFSLSIV